VELHIDSLEHDVPLTPDDLRKLARYLDRLAYAAAEKPGAAWALDGRLLCRHSRVSPSKPIVTATGPA
jgi:hypothetical protein